MSLATLAEDFYIDVDLITEALGGTGSFNIIHLPTMVKADIFIKQRTPWADSEWARRTRMPVGPDEDSPAASVVSAEDMVLQKLEWYRLTGERSDRQWGDVLGILKVQGDLLDREYMKRWADTLGLSTLLSQAMEDAGQ
jgi:hypothetical protein